MSVKNKKRLPRPGEPLVMVCNYLPNRPPIQLRRGPKTPPSSSQPPATASRSSSDSSPVLFALSLSKISWAFSMVISLPYSLQMAITSSGDFTPPPTSSAFLRSSFCLLFGIFIRNAPRVVSLFLYTYQPSKRADFFEKIFSFKIIQQNPAACNPRPQFSPINRRPPGGNNIDQGSQRVRLPFDTLTREMVRPPL